MKSNDKSYLLNNIEKSRLQMEEEERTQLSEGMCFGEWGIIYNIPRTASAYTLEPTDLFCIEKESFDKSFSRCLIRAEAERKKFILQKLPSFKILPALKFDEFYRKVVAIFCKSREIIYDENTKTSVIYLLYQGSCKLQKNFLINKKEDQTINDMKLVTVLNLDKGDICGLEVLKGAPKYNFTLVVIFIV
jgi:hypothetical protein